MVQARPLRKITGWRMHFKYALFALATDMQAAVQEGPNAILGTGKTVPPLLSPWPWVSVLVKQFKELLG